MVKRIDSSQFAWSPTPRVVTPSEDSSARALNERARFHAALNTLRDAVAAGVLTTPKTGEGRLAPFVEFQPSRGQVPSGSPGSSGLRFAGGMPSPLSGLDVPAGNASPAELHARERQSAYFDQTLQSPTRPAEPSRLPLNPKGLVSTGPDTLPPVKVPTPAQAERALHEQEHPNETWVEHSMHELQDWVDRARRRLGWTAPAEEGVSGGSFPLRPVGGWREQPRPLSVGPGARPGQGTHATTRKSRLRVDVGRPDPNPYFDQVRQGYAFGYGRRPAVGPGGRPPPTPQEAFEAISLLVGDDDE